MSQDRLIVVDGYNLILRSPSLRPGEGRTLREARQKLLNLLTWAFGAGQARFLVVFDGAEGGDREAPRGNVEVRYSRPPQKADDLIRAIVEDQMDRVERLTVVTSDLEVARHARAMGADISLSDLFIASALGPGAQSEAETEKPATMSKQELEEWAALFRSRPHPTPEDDEPS